MRFNSENDDTPELSEDPINLVNSKVKENIALRSAELASHLADRQKYFENMLDDASDASSMALVERFAFFAVTIDALIAQNNDLKSRVDDLESRLGGKSSKGGSN